MIADTYTISADGGAITCQICGLTSYHPQDVAFRYCNQCALFHLNPQLGQVARLLARQRGELADEPDREFDTSGRDYEGKT